MGIGYRKEAEGSFFLSIKTIPCRRVLRERHPVVLYRRRSLRRENSFSRFFFLQDDRFGRADLRGKQDLFVGVRRWIDDFGDHFSIELKDFWRSLNAFGVAVALGSIDGDFHKPSFNSAKVFSRIRFQVFQFSKRRKASQFVGIIGFSPLLFSLRATLA